MLPGVKILKKIFLQRGNKHLFIELIQKLKGKSTRLVGFVKSYYGKVRGLSDSPQKIAAGAAMGAAIDFLPIPLINILIAYLLARLLRINAVAAVATVLLLKLAMPFFFTLNVITGQAIAGGLPGFSLPEGFSLPGAAIFEKVLEYGLSFLVGSAVNATITGICVYILFLTLLKRRKLENHA